MEKKVVLWQLGEWLPVLGAASLGLFWVCRVECSIALHLFQYLDLKHSTDQYVLGPSVPVISRFASGFWNVLSFCPCSQKCGLGR